MSRRVLIVDDNEDIVRATSLRLRAAGYETMAAYDGAEGVATATQQHPDVILLDVQMPGTDGLTALGELKECDATHDIPVVMLSASIVDQQAALDNGARYFLRKPYDGFQLVAALDSVISS